MKLQNKVKDIRRRYVERFPVPQGEQGEAFEEVARQWSFRFSEQVRFECPGEDYGMKRADPGRPVSKDTLALSLLDRLLVWDLLTGTGTGHPTLVEDPDSQDVTGQVFVPVTPTNHLGTAGPVDPGPPPPQPDVLLAAIQALSAQVVALASQLDAFKAEARQGFAQLAGVSLRGRMVAVNRTFTMKAKP